MQLRQNKSEMNIISYSFCSHKHKIKAILSDKIAKIHNKLIKAIALVTPQSPDWKCGSEKKREFSFLFNIILQDGKIKNFVL